MDPFNYVVYLIYVDESGSSHKNDSENFIYSALIIHECNWWDINNNVVHIKKRWFPNKEPSDIEFHVTDIVGHKKEYRNMDFNNRYAMLEEIYRMIGYSSLDIISVLIEKDRLTNANFDVGGKALTYLYERLTLFLKKVLPITEDSPYPREYGFIIMDSIKDSVDERMRDNMVDLLTHGTFYVDPSLYLIEDIYFTKSHYRNMTQLADCIAYCIRRKHRHSNNIIDQRFDIFYSLIEPKFDSNASGEYLGYGLKIFP